jgi:hypothetical protein
MLDSADVATVTGGTMCYSARVDCVIGETHSGVHLGLMICVLSLTVPDSSCHLTHSRLAVCVLVDLSLTLYPSETKDLTAETTL